MKGMRVWRLVGGVNTGKRENYKDHNKWMKSMSLADAIEWRVSNVLYMKRDTHLQCVRTMNWLSDMPRISKTEDTSSSDGQKICRHGTLMLYAKSTDHWIDGYLSLCDASNYENRVDSVIAIWIWSWCDGCVTLMPEKTEWFLCVYTTLEMKWNE